MRGGERLVIYGPAKRTIRNRMLGKVFISHSSKDKPFVRRLAKRLWADGYDCWIDETELVPGDMLSTRLSEVLQESRVVIVVVTEHSLESNWLKFELNKAAEWMVDGQCRIIPILKGNVEPPATLKGLIYADIRKSFAKGYKAVLAALQKEADEAISESWQYLDSLIEASFDRIGSASGGDYDSIHYEFVQINGLKANESSGHDTAIVFDAIHDHGSTPDPLDANWWTEYENRQECYGHTYHLVVTERPIEIAEAKNSQKFERISSVVDRRLPSSPFIVVFAYVGGLSSEQEKLTVIGNAKEEIKEIARTLGDFSALNKSVKSVNARA